MVGELLSRRRFLVAGGQVAAAGATLAAWASCGPADVGEGVPEEEPQPQEPNFAGFDLESETVEFQFGPSPEEAEILLGQRLPPSFEPELTTEELVFTGSVRIDERPFISGSATVRLPDGSTGEVRAAEGRITVTYRERSITIAEALGEMVEVEAGEPIGFESLFATFRSETSTAGLAALSDRSRMLVIFSAFASTTGFVRNVDVARTFAFNIDWCYVWSKAGAIALAGLGAAGCFALLAACAGGTVVLPGIGAVSCPVAAGLCGALNAGLQALNEALRALLWDVPES